MLTFHDHENSSNRDNQATADHIVPRSKGGSDHQSNIVAACHRCNCSRKDSTVREWLVRLPLYLKKINNIAHFATVLQKLKERGIAISSVNPEMAPIQHPKAESSPLTD